MDSRWPDPPMWSPNSLGIILRVGKNPYSASHYVERAVNRQPDFRPKDSQNWRNDDSNIILHG